MITIFGTTYYTWLAPYPLLFIIAFLLFLMLVFMLDHWIKTRRIKIQKGLAFWVIVLFTLEVILFWDVVWVAHESKRLCKEEGGLHVYKTVQVDSIKFSLNREKAIKEKLDGGYSAVIVPDWTVKPIKLYRYSLEKDHLIKQEIPKYVERFRVKSNYQNPSHKNRFDYPSKKLTRYIKKTRYFVEDTESGEILSELVYFSIYPGKIDSYLIKKSGLSFTPWFCGNEQVVDGIKTGKRLSSSQLLEATLRPM